MTMDKLRDWHAERAGWVWNAWNEGGGCWMHTSLLTDPCSHPFPATLDGAASAMPDVWTLRQITFYRDDGWTASASCPLLICRDNLKQGQGPTEIHARYALAKSAWEAMT